MGHYVPLKNRHKYLIEQLVQLEVQQTQPLIEQNVQLKNTYKIHINQKKSIRKEVIWQWKTHYRQFSRKNCC